MVNGVLSITVKRGGFLGFPKTKVNGGEAPILLVGRDLGPIETPRRG